MTRETKVGIIVATAFLLSVGGLWSYKKYVLGESVPLSAQNSMDPEPVVLDTPAAPAQPPPPERPEVAAVAAKETSPPVAGFISLVLEFTQERSAEAANLAVDAIAYLLTERKSSQVATAPTTEVTAQPPETNNVGSPPSLTAPALNTGATKTTDGAQNESQAKAVAAAAEQKATTSNTPSQGSQMVAGGDKQPPPPEQPSINSSDSQRSSAALNRPVPSSAVTERRTDAPAAKLSTPDAAVTGGIPVTIRTQPDLPVAPAPATAAPATANRGNGVRPAAQVQDYEVMLYDVRPGDTYGTISQNYYHSDRYQAALAAFNSALDPQTATPVQGKRVRVPPTWVLEGRYRSLIPGLPDAPQETLTPAALDSQAKAVVTERPDAQRQPARLLPNLGPEQNTTGLGSPAPRINPAVSTNATAKDLAQADWAKETKPYKVRPNDTIWSIAKQTLGKGERWPEISRLNRDVLPDVNQIRAGMTLRLPPDAKLDTAETPQ